MAPDPFVQDRSIPQDPAGDRGMINVQTTFAHHLFQITIAERIPPIPPHTQHDDSVLEVSSSEYLWPPLSHSAYLTNACLALCDTTGKDASLVSGRWSVNTPG